MPKFSQRSLDNLKGLHPDLVRLMTLSIRNSPVDFTVVEGVRTTDRQQGLYAQGRTAPGHIVTHCDGEVKKSNHQVKEDGYGYAVDLYPYVSGSVRVSDTAGLKRISEHVKSMARLNGIQIEWGGDWKMKDYPHFELKK